jgi:hypothetical protein
MATSNTNVWQKGFSGNPTGETLTAKTIIEMLDRIGDEMVSPPDIAADDPDRPIMTRRELMARAWWTRAIRDADLAAMKLITEYLDGKPGDAAAAPGETPAFNADDMALGEALLREALGGEGTSNDHASLS